MIALALALLAAPNLDTIAKNADAVASALDGASWTLTTTTQEMDGPKPIHTAIKVEHVTMVKQKATSTVVSCTVDGAGVADKAEREACSPSGVGLQVDTGYGGDPFSSAERAKWRFIAVDANHVRLAQVEKSDAPLAGSAVLDDGGPRAVDLAPTSLPAMAKKLAIGLAYEDVPGIGRVMTTMHVEVVIGVLFLEKSMRTVSRSTDFKKM